MSLCTKCGAEIPENTTEKFCTNCGEPIPVSAPAENMTEKSVPAENAPAENTTEKSVPAENVPAENAAEKSAPEENVSAENTTEKSVPAENVPAENTTEKSAPVENVPAESAGAGEAPQPEKPNTKMLIAVAGVAAVAFLLVISLLVSVFSGGYMGPIDDYMKAVNKKKTDPFVLMTAMQGKELGQAQKDIMKALVKADDDYADSYEDREDYLADQYDDIKDEFDKWKVKFEKKSAKKLDKRDLKDYADDFSDWYEDSLDYYQDILEDEDELEDYADRMDIDEKDAKAVAKAYVKYYKALAEGKISAGYEVKGKFIVKADGDEFKTDTVKLIIVKLNGNWVYLGTDDYIRLNTKKDKQKVLNYLLDSLNSSFF